MAKQITKPQTFAEVEFQLRDGVRELLTEVTQAQMSGQTEIEADPRAIAHFVPQGLGEAGYFWCQGVKVYEKGAKEKSKAEEAKTLEELTFKKTAV